MKTSIMVVVAGLSLLTISSSSTANDREKLEKTDGRGLNTIKASPQQAFPTVRLNSGAIRMTAKVATTAEQRTIGLSGRTTLPLNQGMLFVWPTPGPYCMWMRGTSLPLTALFLSDQGEVLGLEAMNPDTLDRHCAPKPVRYILEVSQRWRGKGRIVVGSVFSGLAEVSNLR